MVFSLPDSSFDIDDATCGARWGQPEYCVNVLAREPALPAFNQHEQLRVLDALFPWSRNLEPSHAQCAEQKANELCHEMDTAARDHVRRLDAT